MAKPLQAVIEHLELWDVMGGMENKQAEKLTNYKTF